MTLSSYIKSNIHLFVLSVIVFVQLLLLVALSAWYAVASSQFQDTAAKASISNPVFSFWDYVWRSGEVMSTYGNIVRTQGYQNDHTNLIKMLFEGTPSSPTTASHTDLPLISSFSLFNIAIQMSVATLCVIGFLSVLNLFISAVLVWKYLFLAQPWNFKKLLLSLSLNLLGFWLSYRIEVHGSPNLSTSPFLSGLKFINTAKQFSQQKQILNLTQDADHPLIEVKNLNFSHHHKAHILRHRSRTTHILKGINLSIKKGSFTVIIGPNGSGKTTLLKTLINLYSNFTGEVLWSGRRISEIHRTDFARQVSYIPQFLNLQNSISVLDFLEFARYPYRQLSTNTPETDRSLVAQAIRKNRCEKLQNRVVNELSGGQKQMIILTSVLVQESEVIVLDEPTSFLDIKNQNQFLEVLANFHAKGKTIIMILHDLRQSIRYADNLIVLHEGRIRASGHPKDVVSKELFRDVFKIDCEISHTPTGVELHNIYAI